MPAQKGGVDRGKRPGRVRSGRGTLAFLGILFLFLVATYAVVLNAIRPHTPGRELPLGELQQRVADKQITDITLLGEDSRFVGVDDRGPWWTGMAENEILEANLVGVFTQAGARTRIDGQTAKYLLKLSVQFLLPTLTLIVGFAFLYTLFRGPGGKELAFLGKSRARRYGSSEEGRVTFADIAGLDEAIEELREVKDFLAAPQSFEAMGAAPPRGLLLAGPPGCGKTLLAKAVAGEAGVPFFSVAATEFVEMLVGVGASRVRDLFEQARAAAPSIVFLDEIDAVGRARSGSSLNLEGESTLNELLVQLDGFDPSARIVLMAATNRPDILDEALIRRGRFDRQIVIDAPDLTGRLAIARVHARGKPLASDFDLERFARRAVGLTGADIAAALNEAAMLAARRRRPNIGPQELDEAIERVLAGPERHSRILDEEEKRRVACHEAGHALVGWVLSSLMTVDKVSIVARGHSLGNTLSLPVDDRRLETRSQMEEWITYGLGGRAAEDVVFSNISGGSRQDLSRATQIARRMVYELGMSDSLGPLALGPGDGSFYREHSEAIAEKADLEVQRILETADARAREVLIAQRASLDQLTEQLAVRETLERSDLEKLLGSVPRGLPSNGRPSPAPSRPVASGFLRT